MDETTYRELSDALGVKVAEDCRRFADVRDAAMRWLTKENRKTPSDFVNIERRNRAIDWLMNNIVAEQNPEGLTVTARRS